jgi:RNA polymerase sigma factor (sigma-70 family)
MIYKYSVPGPFGFLATPDGSIRLNAEGQREITEWYAANPNPWRLVQYAFPARFRFLQKCGYTHEEIDSLGFMAATTAMARFQPEKGFKFSTYLCFWISSETQGLLTTINKSSRYGIKIDSFDEPVGVDGSTKIDYLGQTDDSVMARDDLRASMDLAQQCLKKLPSFKHRELISLYFGMTTGVPMTLDEVGAVFDISRERVRQLIVKGISKIQDAKFMIRDDF